MASYVLLIKVRMSIPAVFCCMDGDWRNTKAFILEPCVDLFLHICFLYKVNICDLLKNYVGFSITPSRFTKFLEYENKLYVLCKLKCRLKWEFTSTYAYARF